MDRPALQRLLDDIRAGQVDVVVVYKIDRLTRSLFDFAKIVEAFDARGVSFVSITQQFNTTTSMGRLTLNVLLSFAQFEREVAGERIRDKIAASKKKGMWMGGLPSLGYDVQNRKLAVNEEEAGTVVRIFRRYVELRSVRVLQAELDVAGIRSKRRILADGSPFGGQKLSRGALTQRGTPDNESMPVLTLTVRARLQRVGREMKMLVENTNDQTEADPALLRIVARAHDIQERLMQKRGLTLHAIASQEHVTPGYVSRPAAQAGCRQSTLR